MPCIPESLSKEIKKKMNIVRHPKNSQLYNLNCRKRKTKAIKENAKIESYRIEHPNEMVPHNVPKSGKGIKQGIKNIREAFRWGENHFNPKEFDESFIRDLAYRITPELYKGMKHAEYRNVGVRVTGSKFTAPYSEKVIYYEIPAFVDNLKSHFKKKDLIENMKAAFYAHFNIARIHPFEDGNGRTARALQDIILDYYEFPLPIIEAGERMTYYNFLENAVEGYRNRRAINKNGLSDEEKSFYLYMTGKVNVSLDKIICKNHFH